MSTNTGSENTGQEALNLVVDRYEEDNQRVPTRGEKQWYSFLTSTLGVVSMILAIVFVVGTTGQLIEPLAEELSLQPEEVETLAAPGSRILAKQVKSKAITDRVTSAGDGIALLAAMVMYGVRVHSILNPVQGGQNVATNAAETISTAQHNGFATASYARF